MLTRYTRYMVYKNKIVMVSITVLQCIRRRCKMIPKVKILFYLSGVMYIFVPHEVHKYCMLHLMEKKDLENILQEVTH